MFVLDTNVVSELRNVRIGKADRNVAAWAGRVDVVDLYVSVITIHELEIGVLLLERRDAKQGATIRRWFTEQVIPAFHGRTLPVDLAVVRRSASLHVPNPRPLRDALIAATAFVHGMTVVTRDVSDFSALSVPILDPWRPAPAAGE